VKWLAVVVILGPGAGVLAALTALAFRIATLPGLPYVPRWVAPHLLPAIVALDAAFALGLVSVAAVLARTPAE
jgi:hypothetical protein